MTTIHLPLFLPPLLVLATTLAAGAAAQNPTPVPAPATADKQGQAATTGKLAEWPALKDTDKDRARALAGQFKKPDAKLYPEAKRGLLQLGAGAAPILIQQVSDRVDSINASLFGVLDEMLDRSHAALMAREAKRPVVELRRYLVHRLCRFGDAEMAPLFEATRKDKDEQTAFYCELGLLAQKRADALTPVLVYCKAHWSEIAGLVAEVLPAARCPGSGTLVFEAIAKANAADQMNGLRLLRYLMAKEQGMLLRRYLEANDHPVKREAVNAARVLHGEPPIDNLSVFQAIEHAKTWLQKL
ncbi:MAG: hypothetical protein WAT39_16395 [Planctomycetota bacterium]